MVMIMIMITIINSIFIPIVSYETSKGCRWEESEKCHKDNIDIDFFFIWECCSMWEDWHAPSSVASCLL